MNFEENHKKLKRKFRKYSKKSNLLRSIRQERCVSIKGTKVSYQNIDDCLSYQLCLNAFKTGWHLFNSTFASAKLVFLCLKTFIGFL